jgi:proteasome lid subunit RPN8/RPN11
MTREHGRIRILQKERPAPDDVEPERVAGVVGGQQSWPGVRPTRHAPAREKMLAADCDIIITQSLYRKIAGHVSSDTSVEQGGLLLGYEETHPSWPRPVVIIDRALEAKHTVGHIARLTFTHETWLEFERETDELRERGINRRRVGWYHSHPGHGIFLSGYDLDVCENFSRPTHVALVVDPVNNDGGFFVRGETGFRSDTPQGFWEWHDLSVESVVNWKSMSAAEVNWEGALPAQTPDSMHEEGAGSSGASVTASQSATNESERPPITPLFDYPDRTRDKPDAQTFVERHRGMTLSEVPLWAAALTTALLLTGVATLGVVVSRMSNTLEKKVNQDDLNALNKEIDELKKGLDNISARVPSPPPPDPLAAQAITQDKARSRPDGTQAADSTSAEPQPRLRNSNQTVRETHEQDEANARKTNRSPNTPPDAVGQTTPPPVPADSTTPTTGEKPSSPTTAATPNRSASPTPSPTATRESLPSQGTSRP